MRATQIISTKNLTSSRKAYNAEDVTLGEQLALGLHKSGLICAEEDSFIHYKPASTAWFEAVYNMLEE